MLATENVSENIGGYQQLTDVTGISKPTSVWEEQHRTLFKRYNTFTVRQKSFKTNYG